MMVNDDSSIVNKLETSLIDDARDVIYDRYMFIVQAATGEVCFSTSQSGLFHFTSQPYCKNCRSAKAKDGIINLILRNYLIDRYNISVKVL
jgi:hypothetical protein